MLSDWTVKNGVEGRLFMASNSNTLFLPAAGYRIDDYYNLVGEYGYYWSASHWAPNFVGGQSFRSEWLQTHQDWYFCNMSSTDRFYGTPIRPVRSVR